MLDRSKSVCPETLKSKLPDTFDRAEFNCVQKMADSIELESVGFFAAAKILIALASSVSTDIEYKRRFNEILDDTNGLRSSMDIIAALIQGVPDEIMLSMARGEMQAARIKLDDADSQTSRDRILSDLNEADRFAVRAIGYLEGNDIAKAITTGLLALAISVRVLILRKIHIVTGDREDRMRYVNFAILQKEELGRRCVSIENTWDARRRFVLNDLGGYDYVVDGNIRTRSNLTDRFAVLQTLYTDKRAELYPALHPMYAAVEHLRARSGTSSNVLCVARVQGRAFLIEGNVAYPIFQNASVLRQWWYGEDDRINLRLVDDELFSSCTMGAMIDEDVSPAFAETMNPSYTASRYSIPGGYLPPPPRIGELWRSRTNTHTYWSYWPFADPGTILVAPNLHWIRPDLVNTYFSGLPVVDKHEYEMVIANW